MISPLFWKTVAGKWVTVIDHAVKDAIINEAKQDANQTGSRTYEGFRSGKAALLAYLKAEDDDDDW